MARGGAKLTASATGKAITRVSAVASAAIQNDFQSRPEIDRIERRPVVVERAGDHDVDRPRPLAERHAPDQRERRQEEAEQPQGAGQEERPEDHGLVAPALHPAPLRRASARSAADAAARLARRYTNASSPSRLSSL